MFNFFNLLDYQTTLTSFHSRQQRAFNIVEISGGSFICYAARRGLNVEIPWTFSKAPISAYLLPRELVWRRLSLTLLLDKASLTITEDQVEIDQILS